MCMRKKSCDSLGALVREGAGSCTTRVPSCAHAYIVPLQRSDNKSHAHALTNAFRRPHSQTEIDQSLLRDYIQYARRFVQPQITDDAERELIEGYLDMRRLGGSAKTITATPRQLESLIRLSEALGESWEDDPH